MTDHNQQAKALCEALDAYEGSDIPQADARAAFKLLRDISKSSAEVSREQALEKWRLPTEEMADSVRGLLQIIRNKPGATFEDVRDHCEQRGDDISEWPQWVQEAEGYVTEQGAAMAIFEIMTWARKPTPSTEKQIVVATQDGLTPVGKYIDLYVEHCGTVPTLNNQEAEAINRLAEWSKSSSTSTGGAPTADVSMPRAWVEAAKCPECGGEGFTVHQTAAGQCEQVQCEFCDTRHHALSAISSTTSVERRPWEPRPETPNDAPQRAPSEGEEQHPRGNAEDAARFRFLERMWPIGLLKLLNSHLDDMGDKTVVEAIDAAMSPVRKAKSSHGERGTE